MNSKPLLAEARVLVVDDTASIHADFQKILGGALQPSAALIAAKARVFGSVALPSSVLRFAVDCVSQGEEGLAAVRRAVAEKRPYALAFVDMRMPPGWDGIETTRRLWEADPGLQVVICTAYSDRTWEDTIAHLGNTDSLLILKKPFDNIEVVQIAHALSTKRAIGRRDRERLADLDERVRQRTAELREAEGRFTKVFHANPVPTTLQNLDDGTYVDANPAFLELVGRRREEICHHTAEELRLWADADIWRETLASLEERKPLRERATRLRTNDRRLRDVLVSVERVDTGAHPLVLMNVEDISERLLLEQKLQQSQKMEAVGQLAAGVAHDFNNLLTVIQSYATMIIDDPQLGTENREAVGQIHTAAERAAALTRQLLVFSRRQIAQPQAIDLSATLARMQDMLRRLVSEDIALEWHVPSALPQLLADEADIEQVIMNLVVNARDAMSQGGRIVVFVSTVSFDQAGGGRHAEARAGRFVQLAIADNGSGMAPDVMARIFEPFFTTKDVGKGTGLGLSTVYAIVRQHGGWVEVASTPGQGTRFDVFLPVMPEGSAPPAKPRDGDIDLAELRGRGERVLIVEDQEDVRSAIRSIALRAGYDVTEAVDGPNALEAVAAAPRPFDLLLTDMVMPNGCSGVELAAQLRAKLPGLKVIISTGYSQDLLKQSGLVPEHANLLLKPYTYTSLLTALRNALNG
ncbi:MAG TPA: response regulator [Opitutaceae bacterium]|nr:response regulator [Opitutaceae bacterium]